MADHANSGASGDAGAQSSRGGSPQATTGLPPGLAAAIALVVAGLAAVGVTGDALTKAVRNEPGYLAAAVILALAASVLLAVTTVLGRSSDTDNTGSDDHTAHVTSDPEGHPATHNTGSARRSGRRNFLSIRSILEAIGQFLKKIGKFGVTIGRVFRKRNSWVTVGLVALLAGVAWAVILGASSVADREQPLVTLTSTSERTGNRTLTVQVSASGLRTSDQVLVQVIGLKKFTQANKAAVQACETNWTYNSGLGDKDVAALSADIGTVLLWNRIGPDPAGKVNATIKIPIPSNGYQGICAWAPLPDRPGQPGDHRNSAAYLKVT